MLTVEPDGRFRLPDGRRRGADRRRTAWPTSPRWPGCSPPPARNCRPCSTPTAPMAGCRWAEFGVDMRESQADMNRPWFEHKLPEVLTALPELDAVLRRPDALRRRHRLRCRLVDDRARPYLSRGPRSRAGTSTGRRSTWPAPTRSPPDSRIGWCSTPTTRATSATQAYDAIFAFECIHDMAQPVATLTADAPGDPAGRRRGRHGRGGGGRVRAARRRPRAADVRLQPAGLPAGRDVVAPHRGDRHRDAAAKPCAGTPARPASPTSRCCPPASSASGASTGSPCEPRSDRSDFPGN